MIVDVPQGLIRLRDGRLVPRRAGFLLPGEHPECPFHHRVDAAMNLHEGAMTITCNHRADVGSARCGALLYIATSTLGPFWCDITNDEDTQIKKLGIKPTGVPRFLGIHFPK